MIIKLETGWQQEFRRQEIINKTGTHATGQQPKDHVHLYNPDFFHVPLYWVDPLLFSTVYTNTVVQYNTVQCTIKIDEGNKTRYSLHPAM